MAEIEEAEGDVGRSREWMARAMRAAPDPAWTADGVVSDTGCRCRRSAGGSMRFSGSCRSPRSASSARLIEPDTIDAAAA